MPTKKYTETLKTTLAREAMITQFVDSGILTNENIIEAFRSVPRHLFVDDVFHDLAYRDQALPIGCNQTISQPSTVARMTELLAAEPHHRVLEIGGGSGFQTAILASLGCKIYSVEWHESLMKKARTLLQELGYYTVRIESGDGSQGWPDAAPFDRIIVTAGAPVLIETLCSQLSSEGRMVIPVGDRNTQKLTIVLREGDHFRVEKMETVEFVDLVGKNGW